MRLNLRQIQAEKRSFESSSEWYVSELGDVGKHRRLHTCALPDLVRDMLCLRQIGITAKCLFDAIHMTASAVVGSLIESDVSEYAE